MEQELVGEKALYGALTEELLASLSGKEGFSIHFYSRIQDPAPNGELRSV